MANTKSTTASGAKAGPDTQTALQRAIERQTQLQLMIKTSGTARLWAENMRRLKIVILFVWFGLWTFLEAFLDIGHRVTHMFGIVSHRSANHNVLVIEGAIWEGLFSMSVAVAVGLLIVKGLNLIDMR